MSHRKQAMQYICKQLTLKLKNPAPTLDMIFEQITQEFWADRRNQWFPKTVWGRVITEMHLATRGTHPER